MTLRRGEADGYTFPVTDEALAPGVASLRDERTVHRRTQPGAIEVREPGPGGPDDSPTAYDHPGFVRMLDVYGGLAAQIVTAVKARGEVAAILSVHQLGAPRRWTAGEIDACSRAAAALTERV